MPQNFIIQQNVAVHSPGDRARTFVMSVVHKKKSALKVPMIRSFRNATGATLKSAKQVIDAVLEDNRVEFTALIGDNKLFELQHEFSHFGYSVAGRASLDDLEPGDYRYLDALIATLPRLPEHPGPASDQLYDIARIAAHLGYPEAAKILDDFLDLASRAAPSAAAIG